MLVTYKYTKLSTTRNIHGQYDQTFPTASLLHELVCDVSVTCPGVTFISCPESKLVKRS